MTALLKNFKDGEEIIKIVSADKTSEQDFEAIKKLISSPDVIDILKSPPPEAAKLFAKYPEVPRVLDSVLGPNGFITKLAGPIGMQILTDLNNAEAFAKKIAQGFHGSSIH